MKRAVLCIAHKGPQQLNVLARQILADSPDSDIYFHIDIKAEAIKAEMLVHPNVHFIQNSHSITWGDDSNVRMLLDAFHEIVAQNKPYEYFQICTGQDIMVKSGLDDFLEVNKGNIYIDMHKNDRYIKYLLTHKYPRSFCKDHGKSVMNLVVLAYTIMTRVGLIPKKKIRYNIKGLDFQASYNWSFMPYEVLCYIVRFLDENPGFLDLYYDTMTPEDGFLGTLIMNSPYRDRVVFKPELDYEIVGREPVRRGESLTFMKKFVGPHPPFLTVEDIPAIESSGCYFARKMDMVRDPEVVQYFEDKLVKKEKLPV